MLKNGSKVQVTQNNSVHRGRTGTLLERYPVRDLGEDYINVLWQVRVQLDGGGVPQTFDESGIVDLRKPIIPWPKLPAGHPDNNWASIVYQPHVLLMLILVAAYIAAWLAWTAAYWTGHDSITARQSLEAHQSFVDGEQAMAAIARRTAPTK